MLQWAMLILMLMVASVSAQDSGQQPTEIAARSSESPPPPLPVAQTAAPAPVRPPTRFVPFSVVSTVLDSNINHDADDLGSFGMVAGLGATFKNDPQRPTLEVEYEAGFHRYANTDRWNRVSHHLRAAWERRLNRRFTFEQVGEVSIKGSTEDHELSNQAVVSPRLEYRLVSWLRIRGVGVWRVKRYDDTPDRNAFNRYAALELIGRPQSGLRWTIGGRGELNAAESERQRYERWTWYVDASLPVGRRDRIEVGGRYLRQHYPYRLVDVSGGPDVPRQDARVEPEIAWYHVLGDRVELRAGYAFDSRDSNDPRRVYRSHQTVFSILTRW